MQKLRIGGAGLRAPKPGSRLLSPQLEGDTWLGHSPMEEKHKQNKTGEWERG